MPKPPIEEVRAQVPERLRTCHETPSYQAAKSAYNDAWLLYIHAVTKGGGVADIERAYTLFRPAAAIYDGIPCAQESGRAHYGLSISAGKLNRRQEALRAARRSAQRLEEHLKSSKHVDREGQHWLVKSLRSLTDSEPEEAARLLNCRRALLLLRGMERACPLEDKNIRQLALVHRAAAGIEAHRHPKKLARLEAAEKHIQTAIRNFKRVREPYPADVSHAKAHRELARILRAKAQALLPDKPREAQTALTAALKALHECARLYLPGVSQWNHYHLAKVLNDLGRPDEALKACQAAAAALESGLEGYDQDDHKIGALKDNLSIYDFGVFLANTVGDAPAGFDLSQRCKARVFQERLARKRAGNNGQAEHFAIPDIQHIQAELAPGEAVLEYHVGRYAVAVFALTAKGLTTRRLPYRRDALIAKVRQLHGFLSQTPNDQTAAFCAKVLADLSNVLIAPVLAALKDCTALHVAPSGPLLDLPFGALPVPQGGRLIERFDLSYLPHASMLLSRKTPSKPAKVKALLALANPYGDLWNAEEEASSIARSFPDSRVLTGPAASKDALRDLKGASFVHIACHGEFLPDDPRGSHLVLSPANEDDDGVLTASEILELPFQNVELTFLSCCKTGRGHDKGCDEIEGVHRAFLEAGSRSVVVTLWDIEDGVTRKLEATFFKHLAAGAAKSTALREAQLEVIRTHQHPYYWAAFKLVGAAG